MLRFANYSQAKQNAFKTRFRITDPIKNAGWGRATVSSLPAGWQPPTPACSRQDPAVLPASLTLPSGLGSSESAFIPDDPVPGSLRKPLQKGKCPERTPRGGGLTRAPCWRPTGGLGAPKLRGVRSVSRRPLVLLKVLRQSAPCRPQQPLSAPCRFPVLLSPQGPTPPHPELGSPHHPARLSGWRFHSVDRTLLSAENETHFPGNPQKAMTSGEPCLQKLCVQMQRDTLEKCPSDVG